MLKQKQKIGLWQSGNIVPHSRLIFLSLQNPAKVTKCIDKYHLYGLQWSGKFCSNKDKWLVWDKPKSLWFEKEWKVLLKQRQTIGLRQTKILCLTLDAEPIFFRCTWLSKFGMIPKMDWHSQKNISSMVWNGVESFAETTTNNWSETNWKIVPRT